LGKKKGLKVTLVDKAALDRSGAVAMGLSAINQYVGSETARTRQTITSVMSVAISWAFPGKTWCFNIARHVDSTVHLFEKWGLKILERRSGKYVHEGRWQLMINGEFLQGSSLPKQRRTRSRRQAVRSSRGCSSWILSWTGTSVSAPWLQHAGETSSTCSKPSGHRRHGRRGSTCSGRGP